ncbi:unnamed protein product [Strongylus vulgaris]|uniref:G-protein coupled receptors family 1 profile domain-containing protein n=1 Tax=Strongylus vulgaris TaxID=40348 RepID=A0A3P7JTI8_STRVU|nr:unnamed protein product [Strongylus vulgaris]
MSSRRALLAAVVLFFTLIGVITNIMLLIVIICHWKISFRSQHFTFFVLNMITSGLVYSVTNLWVSVPCTLNECPFISSDTVMITLATPNTLGHWGYLLSSLAFTVYRFGLFMSKSIAERTTCIKV